MTNWAEEELKTVSLGDARLDKRAVMLTEQLAQRPGVSIPQACGDGSANVGNEVGVGICRPTRRRSKKMRTWQRIYRVVSFAGFGLASWGASLAALPTETHTPTIQANAEFPTDLFDRIVSPETVFPNPAQRRNFELLPIPPAEGRRSYSYSLKPQPGMKRHHFYVVLVSWAPGGYWIKDKSQGGPQTGMGGLNASMIDTYVQTDDGVYDLRVGVAMSSLPNHINVDFDMNAAAQYLIRLYAKEVNKASIN